MGNLHNTRALERGKKTEDDLTTVYIKYLQYRRENSGCMRSPDIFWPSSNLKLQIYERGSGASPKVEGNGPSSQFGTS